MWWTSWSRRSRSDRLFKLSTSSSVTWPPNTTFLIPSDGYNHPQNNSQSANQQITNKTKKITLIAETRNFKIEFWYLVRPRSRARGGGGERSRVSNRSLGPGEQIRGGCVWLPHRSIPLHFGSGLGPSATTTTTTVPESHQNDCTDLELRNVPAVFLWAKWVF